MILDVAASLFVCVIFREQQCDWYSFIQLLGHPRSPAWNSCLNSNNPKPVTSITHIYFFFSLYLISPLPDLQFCFLVLPARISHSYQKLLLYTRKSLITSVFRTEPFFLFYSRDKRDRKTHDWVVPHFPVTVSCHCNHQTTPTNFFPVLFLPLARKHLWTQIHHCCVGKR